MCKHEFLNSDDNGNYTCQSCNLPIHRFWMDTVPASLRLQREEIPAHFENEVDWNKVKELNMVSVIAHRPSERAAEMLSNLIRLDYEAHHGCPKQEHLIPVKEMTQDELAWTQFGEHTPELTGYFSLPHKNEKGEIDGKNYLFSGVHVNIYWDGTAIAIHRCWKYEDTRENSVSGKLHKRPKTKGMYSNDMTIRFYLLGCKHEYEEVSGQSVGLTLFRMEHAYKCKHCSHVYAVDSSD